MKARRFNSVMHLNNEAWAARILGMNINPSHGPDLIDDEKAVELKFNLVHPDRYSHKSWRVLGYQLPYGNSGEVYWGFGFYTLDREISQIHGGRKKIGSMVLERELYLVQWDWINQFPIYHHRGHTKISEWDYDILFPKFRLLPKVTHEFSVSGGKIFATEGVNPDRFLINQQS